MTPRRLRARLTRTPGQPGPDATPGTSTGRILPPLPCPVCHQLVTPGQEAVHGATHRHLWWDGHDEGTA